MNGLPPDLANVIRENKNLVTGNWGTLSGRAYEQEASKCLRSLLGSSLALSDDKVVNDYFGDFTMNLLASGSCFPLSRLFGFILPYLKEDYKLYCVLEFFHDIVWSCCEDREVCLLEFGYSEDDVLVACRSEIARLGQILVEFARSDRDRRVRISAFSLVLSLPEVAKHRPHSVQTIPVEPVNQDIKEKMVKLAFESRDFYSEFFDYSIYN